MRIKSCALLLMMVFVSTVIIGCGGTQQAPKQDKPITLKVGHAAPPSHPYQFGLEEFAKLVDKKTNGKVKIQTFHSSQLGNEREMIEGLIQGQAAVKGLAREDWPAGLDADKCKQMPRLGIGGRGHQHCAYQLFRTVILPGPPQGSGLFERADRSCR